MVVAATPASIALAFLSVILLWSQLNFAKAHATAESAQQSVKTAFEAIPDAVLVVNASYKLTFSKEFSAPFLPALPLLTAGDRIASEELQTAVADVMQSADPKQNLVHLSDGRVLELRVTPYTAAEVLVIARDITESHKDGERIRYLATHDSMTGLLNRNSFHVALDQAIARAKRSKKAFGLLFLDLDHFKAVNDTLGHEAGDELLKEVARRMTETLRRSDSAYRLAGDEFTALIEGLDSDEDVFLVAQKLCEALAKPYFTETAAPQVSASIGAVVYPREGSTADELVRLADRAMYQAKAQGRNKAAVLSPVEN